MEHHGAERVPERLLVPAHAIPKCPAWRRSRCDLLVQWLLLRPRNESWGRVVTWRSHESLRPLLSCRYWVGVHGDVSLPWAEYVGHGEVAPPLLLVDLVEATVVRELPPRLPPLLLFLPPLPPLR
jgi:hypothetical protein